MCPIIRVLLCKTALFYIKTEQYREENISSTSRVSGTGSRKQPAQLTLIIIFSIEYNGGRRTESSLGRLTAPPA
jgi:hypothetical protein